MTMKEKPVSKPRPVVVATECSLCGEPWEDHGDDPTAETCVALLLAKIARTPQITLTSPHDWYPQTWPYQPTWVAPMPYNDHTITCVAASAGPAVVDVR